MYSNSQFFFLFVNKFDNKNYEDERIFGHLSMPLPINLEFDAQAFMSFFAFSMALVRLLPPPVLVVVVMAAAPAPVVVVAGTGTSDLSE